MVHGFKNPCMLLLYLAWHADDSRGSSSVNFELKRRELGFRVKILVLASLWLSLTKWAEKLLEKKRTSKHVLKPSRFSGPCTLGLRCSRHCWFMSRPGVDPVLAGGWEEYVFSVLRNLTKCSVHSGKGVELGPGRQVGFCSHSWKAGYHGFLGHTWTVLVAEYSWTFEWPAREEAACTQGRHSGAGTLSVCIREQYVHGGSGLDLVVLSEMPIKWVEWPMLTRLLKVSWSPSFPVCTLLTFSAVSFKPPSPSSAPGPSPGFLHPPQEPSVKTASTSYCFLGTRIRVTW